MRVSFLVIAAGLGVWLIGRGIWLLMAGVVLLAAEEYLHRAGDSATERARLAKQRDEDRVD